MEDVCLRTVVVYSLSHPLPLQVAPSKPLEVLLLEKNRGELTLLWWGYQLALFYQPRNEAGY